MASMTSSMDTQSDTPASEKSLYFDAPIAHFDMDASSQIHDDDSSGQPVTQDVSHTPLVVAEDSPAKPQSKPDKHKPGDVVYVDGNWVVRKPSRPSSQKWAVKRTVSRSPSPAPSSLQTEGHRSERRRIASVNGSTRRGRSSVRSYGGGSTFASGAGTTGPAATATVDQRIRSRAVSADASLTPKQRSKIIKGEQKDGKQLTKLIKKESKIEKEALSVAIKELAELQALQKAAIRVEAKAHSVHAAAVTSFQRAERAFLDARTKFDTAQAEMVAHEEALETSRRNAREATENMQDKMREVDLLRAQKGVDDRERELKITELKGKKSTTLRK